MNFNFIQDIKAEQAKAAQEAAKNATVNAFDSAAGDAAKAVLSAEDQAFNSELVGIRRDALFGVLQLSDDILSDDLDDDELPSDRLDAYLNGEDGDDEDPLNEQVMQIKAAFMADALSSLGVSDDLIAAAFDVDVDAADDAISKISEIVETNTPTGDDLDDFITQFLYGDDGLDMEAGQVEEYDSAQLGKNKTRKTKAGQTLVYRGVKAVRNGKITVVNKRIGNTQMKVKLSPKQKLALRKAALKAVRPNAIKKRIKSLKLGHRSGIYNQNKGL